LVIEEIQDAWQDARYNDLENGVQWINEMESEMFEEDYPTISKFGIVLNKIATRIAEAEDAKPQI
jgi:hypothetical protein